MTGTKWWHSEMMKKCSGKWNYIVTFSKACSIRKIKFIWQYCSIMDLQGFSVIVMIHLKILLMSRIIQLWYNCLLFWKLWPFKSSYSWITQFCPSQLIKIQEIFNLIDNMQVMLRLVIVLNDANKMLLALLSS